MKVTTKFNIDDSLVFCWGIDLALVKDGVSTSSPANGYSIKGGIRYWEVYWEEQVCSLVFKSTDVTS